MAPDALAARVVQLEEELATVQAQVGTPRTIPSLDLHAPLVQPAQTPIGMSAQLIVCTAGRGGSH